MSLNIGSLVGFLDLDASGFEDTLGGAMDKLKDLGPKGAAIAGVAGAAIGTAIAAGVFGGMDIEKANDKLAAQLGANGQYAADLGTIAGNLYAGAYGDSLDQVNEALRGVLQSGAVMEDESNAQIESVTGKVLDLATAFDQDLGGTTQAVGQMVRNGLAKDADEALDILTRGFQQGVDKSGDLLDTMNEYPTVLRDLGLNGTESMGLLRQGLGAGARDADTVADALKELAIRGQDGSQSSADGFKALGLNGKLMTEAFAKGGPAARKATDQVLDGLRGIEDPAKRNAAAVQLFGTKAEDLGDALFSLDLDSAAARMGTVEGATAKMGKTLNDNAATNIESFKRKAQQAFVDIIGGKALPIVNDLAAMLAGQFEPALAAAGAALTTVTGFLQEHQTAALVLVGVIGALVAITQLHAAVMAVQAAGGILAYLATLGPVRAATAAWTAVQWLLNTAMSMNPIMLVVIAIAALVAGIIYAYRNSETFRNIVNAAWAGIKTGVKAVVDWLTTAIPAVFRWIVTAFEKYTPVGIILSHWSQIRDFIGRAVGIIVGHIQWFASLPGKFADWFGRANAAAVSKATALVTFVKGLPAKVLAGLGNLGSTLYNKGADLIRGLIDGAGSMLSRLGSFFLDAVPSWIREPFKKALGIASPSRVMAALSRWIPLGVVEGVQSQAGAVRAAMRDLVQPPTMPALTVPQVRMPAASLLDPNVNRDAARGYAGGAQGREPVDLSTSTITAIAAAVSRINVKGEISAGQLDRAMGANT